MSTEPSLVTPPHLLGVLEELRQREPIFHHPEFGSTRADYERMTADDYWEIGASGRRYSREHVFDVLDARRNQPVDESDWESRANLMRNDAGCIGQIPALRTGVCREHARSYNEDRVGACVQAITVRR